MTELKLPALRECECGADPDLQLLRDLLALDMDAWDASAIAFGHAPKITAPMWVRRIWCHVDARRVANQVRGQFGLPALPFDLAPRVTAAQLNTRSRDSVALIQARIRNIDPDRVRRGMRSLAAAIAKLERLDLAEVTRRLDEALNEPIRRLAESPRMIPPLHELQQAAANRRAQ